MYQDLLLIQTLNTGDVLTAALMTQARDNGEFHIDPPACSIKESTAQSIPNNAATVLTSNEENFDNDSLHSTVTNTSRITVQTAGRYLFAATVFFTSNGTGVRVVRLIQNGGTSFDLAAVSASSGSSTVLSFVKPLVMAATDYAEVQVLQTSGGALDVVLTDFSTYFMTR